MTFNETEVELAKAVPSLRVDSAQQIQPRDGIGRFSEKLGGAPEVALEGEFDEPEYDFTPKVQYTIPAHNLPAFQERIDKANRKLERAGIEDRFGMTYDMQVRHEGDGSITQVAVVDINRPTIALGDYNFLAYHETTEAGGFITHSQGRDIDDPTDTRCDHCKLNRHRGKLYTVQNKETGEVLQVGSTCLEPFFGVKPSGLWALEEDMDALGAEEFEYEPGGPSNSFSKAYDGDALFLAAYRATGGGENYISRDRATYDSPATADKVREYLDTTYNGDDGRTAGENPTAEEAEYIARLKTFLNEMEPDGEYERNLKSVLSPDENGNYFVGRKHIGIAASAVAAMKNAERRAASEAARAAAQALKKEAFLALPKAKLEGVKVKVTKRIPFNSKFGGGENILMQDDQGHVLKWSTSSFPELEEGVEYVMKATVKDNEVYHGDWQTGVIRPKFEKQG